MASGQSVDQYPEKDITVSLFRESYPRELFTALRTSGHCIEERFPGVYYVTGSLMFDTQIVAMSRLDPATHSLLRILSMKADKEDVKRFIRESSAPCAASVEASCTMASGSPADALVYPFGTIVPMMRLNAIKNATNFL